MAQYTNNSEHENLEDPEEEPSKRPTIRPDGPEPCFFCGKASTDESHFLETICRSIKILDSDRVQRSAEALLGLLAIAVHDKFLMYQKREVVVPRCTECEQVHDSVDKYEVMFMKLTMLFGAICVFFFAFFILLFTIPSGPDAKVPAERIAFVLGIVVSLISLIILWPLGSILAYMFGRRKMPEGVEPVEHAKDYHIVRDMEGKGWQALSLPEAPPRARLIELPPEFDEQAEELYIESRGQQDS